MDVYVELALIYISVSVVLAVRIGMYAAKHLDEYEWQFNGSSHRFTLIWWPVVWPLLLLKPKLFFNPSELFVLQWSLATVPRELDQLRANLPLCGSKIIYRPYSCYGDTHGEFTFKAGDVEQQVMKKLKDSPHLGNDHEGGILAWVKNRDEAVTEVQLVPNAWSRFQYIAGDLIRDGRSLEVRCISCGVIDQGLILEQAAKGPSGWSLNRFKCPAGHTLLLVEGAHFYYKQVK